MLQTTASSATTELTPDLAPISNPSAPLSLDLPSVVPTQLVQGLLPCPLRIVNYPNKECPNYLANLTKCRADAAQRLINAKNATAADIASFRAADLAVSDLNEAVIIEILSAPECSGGDIPNYFDANDHIRKEMLPDCLKDFDIKSLSELSCTQDEFNLFIWEVLVVSIGREDFFSDTPGQALNFIFDMDLLDNTPWQEHLHPLSPEDQKTISDIILKLLAAGQIEFSRSAYASGVILVRKPSGRNQLASNLVPLNNNVRKTAYPLPLISDNLFYLNQPKHLSPVHISGAYLSLPTPHP